YTSLPIPYEPPNKRMRTPGELRLVRGLDNLETLVQLFPGVTPEALADLDLGTNLYLTPFGAEQTQQNTQTPSPTTPGSNPATPQPASPANTQTAKWINVNTAPAEVLKAVILGVLPNYNGADAAVQNIVESREPPQGKQFKSLNDVTTDTNLRSAL